MTVSQSTLDLSTGTWLVLTPLVSGVDHVPQAVRVHGGRRSRWRGRRGRRRLDPLATAAGAARQHQEPRRERGCQRRRSAGGACAHSAVQPTGIASRCRLTSSQPTELHCDGIVGFASRVVSRIGQHSHPVQIVCAAVAAVARSACACAVCLLMLRQQLSLVTMIGEPSSRVHRTITSAASWWLYGSIPYPLPAQAQFQRSAARRRRSPGAGEECSSQLPP